MKYRHTTETKKGVFFPSWLSPDPEQKTPIWLALDKILQKISGKLDGNGVNIYDLPKKMISYGNIR